MIGSESFMGHFEFVVAIPATYLLFMLVLTVPVVVIDDLPALTGLRRSWHLIRGQPSARRHPIRSRDRVHGRNRRRPYSAMYRRIDRR
jgi:hypothetical protein